MYHTKDTRQLELESFVLPSPRTTERDRKEATDVQRTGAQGIFEGREEEKAEKENDQKRDQEAVAVSSA